MRATLVVLVVAALCVATLPFVDRADAREGQLASPVLRERAADGATLMTWDGTSDLQVQGACLALRRLCLGSTETVDGRFFLPAAASAGTIVVTWQPANDSLRELRVSVGGRTLVGGSPLTIELPSASSGEYAVRAEPNGTLFGSWEQPVRWTASFLVGEPPESIRLGGVAGHSSTAGCVLDLCERTLRQHGDPMVVPWEARGSVVVTWDRGLGPLAIGIGDTSFAAEGETPLVIPVDGLAAGQWRVIVRSDVVLPLERIDLRWDADLAKREQTSS